MNLYVMLYRMTLSRKSVKTKLLIVMYIIRTTTCTTVHILQQNIKPDPPYDVYTWFCYSVLRLLQILVPSNSPTSKNND